MSQSEDLLDGARSIRPFLADLLGPDADAVDRTLADLLAQATAGQPVEKQVAGLLASREKTREWMRGYMARRKTDRGLGEYEQLPGSPPLVRVLYYTCPQNDYIWPLRVTGQKIPNCPTHNIPLVPLQE